MILVISIDIKIIRPVVQNYQEADQLSERSGSREKSKKVVVENDSDRAIAKFHIKLERLLFLNENLPVCKSQESSARCSGLMLYLTMADVDVADA